LPAALRPWMALFLLSRHTTCTRLTALSNHTYVQIMRSVAEYDSDGLNPNLNRCTNTTTPTSVLRACVCQGLIPDSIASKRLVLVPNCVLHTIHGTLIDSPLIHTLSIIRRTDSGARGPGTGSQRCYHAVMFFRTASTPSTLPSPLDTSFTPVPPSL
jgi:hypothetical protein